MDRELIAKAPRVLAVAAMGAGTFAAAYLLGIPGSGLFLLVAGLAGFATAIVAPCWIGYAVLLGSIALTCWVSPVLFGTYGGLILLVIASLWVPASVGWLVGYVARRVRMDGLRASLRNVRVLSAGFGAVGLAWFIVYVAGEFATNPP